MPNVIEIIKDELNDWQLAANENSITQKFTFINFSQAFAFMSEIAMIAEKLNHHPDWSNSYNNVEISLTTHDMGKLSQKDVDFATLCDKVYRNYQTI